MCERKTERKSGIELLRILLMLQIIFLHVAEYGEYASYAKDTGGVTEVIYWSIWLLSRCPVFVYIMIMGYFMVTKEYSIKECFYKIRSTYLVMLFYSLSIPFLGVITGMVELDTTEVVSSFLPFLNRTWYFMTLYLLVLFFVPFVNKSLKRLTKREYTILILGMFFIFSIWTMLNEIPGVKEVVGLEKVIDSDSGKSLYGFLYVYILGGYIRLHIKSSEKAKWRYLLGFFLLGVINILLTVKFPGYQEAVVRTDNPIVVVQGMLLLLYFRDLQFRSRVINKISANNIGVYMIHEHPFVRVFFWELVFSMTDPGFYQSKNYPLMIIINILTVYIICSIVEYLRNQLFKACSLGYKRIKKI